MIKKGIIISDLMDKTRIILIKNIKKNIKYKKNFLIKKKYFAHDEKNLYKKGDIVYIKRIRPLSKNKKWLIIKKTICYKKNLY
ncbi:MAG: 30S ribosomal protein S17 [Candidatus Shikimatogenerans sp. Tduv]|uniref:30S ribosomal protein S17 n=1 Tax=Candidatus Shikimatogenerans sp. Tduv TaxID=3158567 RepID=A0AAU7QR99_9FLAO